ncbi:putative disease resistance protein [Cardamine amara subsp. amara]|uniref:Disease resistance protein n=1 Tax=Cardamine amara subsp. amara TaxID=228776 RepID=A0ABD1B4U8_CARAN
MTSLVFLDLSSHFRLKELPEEVSSLVLLQFLNLSHTRIRRLPLGLKELKSLIHLDLDHTYKLQELDVIASLFNLKVLRLFQNCGMIDLRLIEEVESIQDKIGESISLFYLSTMPRRDKASAIYRLLNRKRFVLLFDDLPKKVNLEEIGVPLPSKRNGCKVVFTTRSRKPCGSNWVDAEVEVTCLSSEEACDLFLKTLEETTLKSHQDIPKLTRVVARKCRGLPLALSVISKIKACKKMVREWHHAIYVLVSSAAESSVIEDEILPILKLSYDSLPGESIRLCFLYCALFPKHYKISKEDLVEFWIGEGIIKAEDREIAEIKGYGMIGELVRMGLLMENENGYGVKMHDVVSEVALWIASDFGRQKEYFVMISGDRIQEMPEVNDWRMVRRMSVRSTQIESISDSPQCTQLTTLFLKRNENLKWISGDFFQCMTSLVLLDMSHNIKLEELPEEVSSLVSLQFLNLSWTRIKRLPLGLKELKSLIHLDLDYISNLQGIDVIASLLNLQVLRLFRSVPRDLSLMEDIQLLKNLKELSLSMGEDAVLQRLLSIHTLASCIRRVCLIGTTITNGGILSLKAMSSLRELNIGTCNIPEITTNWRSTIQKETVHFRNIENIPHFSNIRTVSIVSCKGLQDLTWLLFAPSLGDLSLIHCPQIEGIISREKAMAQLGHTSEQPFQNLTRLSLRDLPELESIYWTPLPFPVLEYLQIKRCPKLRKLPFNSESSKGNQLQIELEEESVEWEDEATKQHFSNFKNRESLDRFYPLYDLASIQNIVVVGTKGTGKSATANCIAGKTVFNPLAHTSDGSTRCHNRFSVSRVINVIDTPGLFDLLASPEFISNEILRCLTLAEGGIHAVLLVFSAGKQISEEEEHIVSTLHLLFGSIIFDYLIVVFTGGDKLENDQVILEEFLRVSCPDFLKRVLEMCGNRMILFDNKTKDEGKKRQQIHSLQSLVEQERRKVLRLKGLSEEEVAMIEKELDEPYFHKLKGKPEQWENFMGLNLFADAKESENDEELRLRRKELQKSYDHIPMMEKNLRLSKESKQE